MNTKHLNSVCAISCMLQNKRNTVNLLDVENCESNAHVCLLINAKLHYDCLTSISKSILKF